MAKAQGGMEDVSVGRKFKMAASEQDLDCWKNIPKSRTGPVIPQRKLIKWADHSGLSLQRPAKSKDHTHMFN